MKISGTFCLGLFLCTMGASAQTDWEFFSSSCTVKESLPGFKFQNISALGVAALLNASDDIGTFLDIGCDPNFDGTSLTYIETECENPIFIKLGISCAREVKIEGYTPLILAVIYGTAATVKQLSQIPQIDLDAKTSNLYSALWAAASSGNLEMVRILAEAGANLEVGGGEYLMKPLGAAVRLQDLDLVRYLISKGANVNSKSNTGSTPANYASNSGNVEILKMLRAAGADLYSVGPEDTTLLIIATVGNTPDVVDYLISQKVDLNRQDQEGRNALSFSAFYGYLDILQSLVKAGAELDTLYGEDQYSALSTALLADNRDVALFLIKSGANVDTQSSKGFTSSSIAAQKGNLSALKALAEAGANLETKGGSFEMTPLAFAAFRGHLEILQYLKGEGVDIDATDKDGKTALELAREVGNDDVVIFLEEK